jgi:4'-phosphopantetheinyl transferase EntD
MTIASHSLFAGLLAPCVAIAEGEIAGVAGSPWPEEEDAVRRAVEGRRREFAAGRILARRALAAVGAPAGPIPAGPDRAPRWPAGFVGSIAHSRDYAEAAAARLADIASVGVDVEEPTRFDLDLEPYLLTPSETDRHLGRLRGAERQAVTAIIFCAKEAWYKAQYPLTGRRLGFHDVEAELAGDGGDMGAGVFDVRRLGAPASPPRGRFAVIGDRVVAAIAFSPGVTAAVL